MSPVGAALIGATGAWGPRIAAAVDRAARLRLVTCYARDRDRLARFAGEHDFEAASSFEAAIGHPDVEAVLLVTPNDLHEEQALAASKAGKHVFVEKPIAHTVEAGERMRERFAAAGLVLAVGHGMRRLGAARRVKELLEAGSLGTVVLAEANWSLPSRMTAEAWRWYRDRAPGGPLLQLGVHHADTLAYWLGPVRRSYGSFARVATDAEIDDVGVVTLEFASGARGAITGSYVSPATYRLRLCGTEAVLDYAIDMSVWPRADQADAATTVTLRSSAGERSIEFSRRDPLVEELEEFACSVRGGAVPETGADEGIAALKVILDAVASQAS